MKPAIHILGCASGVGKSLLTAGLARALRRRGLRVAPFKAQNMSLQAAVTPDGSEIARSQWLQARACGLPPDVRMNPVLVKPLDDRRAQVIVNGKPDPELSALPWRERQARLWPQIREAYDSLLSECDAVVIEGAGSPAEVNLADADLANLAMARHASAAGDAYQAYLVADIDRGGAYAHVYGTWCALPDDVRGLLSGFVLNKFRGDASLLASANAWLLEKTGIPVVAVLPHLSHGLPEEDSAHHAGTWTPGHVNLAVLEYPGASNLDDFDPLRAEPCVSVVGVTADCNLRGFDAVFLPGTRQTARGRAFLRESGLERSLQKAVEAGVPVFGICGGLQLLGARIIDPLGIEGPAGVGFDGLNLLPLKTELHPDKVTREIRVSCEHGFEVAGYEIHHGRTAVSAEAELPVPHLAEGLGWRDGRVTGVYLHGLFHDDRYRRHFLASLGGKTGGEGARERLERDLDALADAVEASGWVSEIRA